MKGIFINGPYARQIALGLKTIETRTRNMLGSLIAERVALIETGYGRPVVVGYAYITDVWYCGANEFHKYDRETRVYAGSKYDCFGPGKWMYEMANAEPCYEYELPANAIRHGRSWCEFNINEMEAN